MLKDLRNKPLVPWRIMAFRLIEAMNLWKTSTGKLKGNSKEAAGLLADQVIKSCLNTLESRGVEAQPDYRSLVTWKDGHKPKSTQVLAEDESTTVK